MTKQHAVTLLTNALTGSNDNPAFHRLTTAYAGALVGLAGLVLSDPENFFDEALGDEDDQARGEALDRLGLFANVQRG